MRKKTCMLFQFLLLAWFFLDMTGVSFGGSCLVTRSYAEDGVFFLLYLAVLALFVFKEKIGKWIAAGWLSMWLILQFLSHEWYTIFGRGFMGPANVKIEFFSGTLHWLEIPGRYVPDVYHTVLHVLLVLALTATVIYMAKPKKKR